MCGIFGYISTNTLDKNKLSKLVLHARQRGRDSSGFIYRSEGNYNILRSDTDISKLYKNNPLISDSDIALGHSRLITNGLNDNQPVVRDDYVLLHNGIIVNTNDIWKNIKTKRLLKIDSEAIIGVTIDHFQNGGDIENLSERLNLQCKGTNSCAILIPKLNKLFLYTNNGSLYLGISDNNYLFSSERYPLEELKCNSIKQIDDKGFILNIPNGNIGKIIEDKIRSHDLIPEFKINYKEESILEYNTTDLLRCSKCILPETMPFISFDNNGVCNYCNNYSPRNIPKPKSEIFDLVKPYRKKNGSECIVPFSGGRDSCYGLHLIIEELNLKPITYTYDWGMVTDLGRRNISRMCAKLGVENIIIAADITKKRKNIARNLKAWLKAPHLGMVSILTAGDKHFFRHVETVKKQTGISLNLWGVNPLEVTHFKAGFLGVKPDFEEKRVYMHGINKQLNYQKLRFKAMLKSLGYFNLSLFDTISGEYYRSFTEKTDYFHIFDYWMWEEKKVDDILENYDWEKAIDTNTTWRIGDGTAAFYNYIYYTVAGFTEHDTFRSNQIREGQISREEALNLVKDENRPRYQNIRWYLDAIKMDYIEIISTINKIPKLTSKII